MLHDFKTNDIFTLYLDSRHRLWIPIHTEHHLVCAEGGKTTNRFRVDGKDVLFPAVTVIKELRSGVFVFGTLSEGLSIYNEKEETLRQLTAKELGQARHERIGSVTAIVADASGDVWVSTTKSGIWRFDSQMKLRKRYQGEDGMRESYISTLFRDARQNIWALTGSNIYRLDPVQDVFVRMEADNIPSQEFSLYGSGASHDSVVYFSGNGGIVTFNPHKLEMNPCLPKVYLTSLHINNRLDTSGADFSSSSFQLQDNAGVTLNADQTNIVINYTGLSYIHSNQTQYAYRLDGVDKGWVFVGNRRQAFYSNLNPGKYTFHVKACNSDGIWSGEEALLHLTVKPPLWQTWWAFLLYFAVISTIVWRFLSFRRRQRELENNIRFKQLEKEKIEELHTERMRLFTNFSHELRTPLTLIINPLEDLLQKFSFSAEVKGALQMMKKNTGRLLLLVNNLMDIQRYEAGKTVLQRARFDFSTFLTEMYDSFDSVARNRSIAFRLDSKLPVHFYVNYDKEEMDKVFFNLLSNAFKFTPVEGKIRMIARPIIAEDACALPGLTDEQRNILIEEKYLYIEVADTGQGIESDQADKIFEPFFRSGEDVHRQIAGTGIGLSLTRSIVLQHHGVIWTESSPSAGTRMMLLLPDTEKQPEINLLPEEMNGDEEVDTSRKVALLLEEADSFVRKTVLIVDDNEEVRNYLEQQLQTDFIIRQAANGREALALIENAYPDIVISDVMMPEMNGLELCRKIKENINYCHIPVILLTAKSLVSQIEEGWEVGADDYIVKPFHVSLLRARIRNILASREKMKELYSDKLSLKSLGVEPLQPDDSFLTQYIDIVKKNISNSDLDVALICQEIGMSRANFYRKVKAVTGLSPIELIKNIRLEAGARLLEETALNITEISRQIGFGSSSYFAKNFRAMYGISPTEYQERKQKPS